MQRYYFLFILLFISNLDFAQSLSWAKQMKGTESNGGLSVAVDDDGNVYSTGWFSGTVDFDPGANTTNVTAVGLFDVYIQKLDNGGNLLWVKTISGSSTERGLGRAIKLDAAGNIYTMGQYKGTFDFDPNAGVYNLTSTDIFGTFIQKLDANGNFIWAKSIESQSNAASFSIDNQGNIYMVGSFSGTVDFDPDAGIQNVTSAGNGDYFILKLNNVGSFEWVKSIGSNNIDLGKDIDLDTQGNLYITGCYENTVDFDPNAGVSLLTSNGVYDIFIQKLDANGNLIWIKSIGGAGRDVGNSLKIDALGNVYSTGGFSGTVDFDPNNGVFNLTTSLQKGYILKLDNNGQMIWAKSINWNGYDSAILDLDNDANVYSTGYFRNTVDFDPNAGTHNITAIGMWDIFIHKLDANGNFVWAKSMKASQYSSRDGSRANGIIVDNCSNIYITGLFEGSVDFNPDDNATEILTAVNYASDIFVQKILQNTNTTPGVDTIVSCTPIVWIDGNTYSENNNTAIFNTFDINGCDSTVVLNLTIIEDNSYSIHINLISDDSCSSTCNGIAEVIIAGGTQPYSYNWTKNGETVKIATQLCEGKNTVVVTDNKGCKANTSINIGLISSDLSAIYAPNAFTPNGDGLNDEFLIKGIPITEYYHISIFNRWGENIFTSNDVSENWNGTYNGKTVAGGVYFYYLNYYDSCANKKVTKRGCITLLR